MKATRSLDSRLLAGRPAGRNYSTQPAGVTRICYDREYKADSFYLSGPYQLDPIQPRILSRRGKSVGLLAIHPASRPSTLSSGLINYALKRRRGRKEGRKEGRTGRRAWNANRREEGRKEVGKRVRKASKTGGEEEEEETALTRRGARSLARSLARGFEYVDAT